MAKQIVNIGTSANKGDGDPLRSAFDKINDNFGEVYPRIQSLEAINNTAGNTIEQDIIGSVFANDSTLLVNGVTGKITADLESSNWIKSSGNITLQASTGTVVLQSSSGNNDYVKVSGTGGIDIHSDTTVQIKTQGQAINIGVPTSSGDVTIGYSTSNTTINGTLNATLARTILTSYTTTQRNGLAAANGEMIYNQTTGKINAYVNGAWAELN